MNCVSYVNANEVPMQCKLFKEKKMQHKGVCARLGTGTGKRKLVRVSFSERVL
ncbi:hypothetical protein DPMN_087689 [Dreissena polymorpha]|uniref:Uncharacterized protein n=1 Tax=Dreissena polymorpha TaxID=45954 RepID=A0A9D4KTE9_DREPO|nr:hypothetical protein DPMN_087689 [Dreissena polymorpha]